MLVSHSSNKVTVELAVTEVPGYVRLCHSQKLAKVNFDLARDVSKAVACHKCMDFFLLFIKTSLILIVNTLCLKIKQNKTTLLIIFQVNCVATISS